MNDPRLREHASMKARIADLELEVACLKAKLEEAERLVHKEDRIKFGLKGYPGRGNIGIGGRLGSLFPVDADRSILVDRIGRADAEAVLAACRETR